MFPHGLPGIAVLLLRVALCAMLAQSILEKPEKVALVGCMRKLLTILNAMLRDQTP